MSEDYDVLIAGGGPAGSTAAERLARVGWRVALLEEHEQIGRPVNCSGVISVEAFERYQLPESLIRHTLQAVEFRSPGGLGWSFEARKPLAYAVERSQMDQILAQRAQEAGAEVLLGSKVTGVERDSEGVRVWRQEDPLSPLRGKVVILATGAGVPLIRHLDLGSYPRWLVGVQTEIPVEGVERVEIHLGKAWAPEGFAWIIPLGRGMAKVGLLADRDGPDHLRHFLERPDIRPRLRGEVGIILCSILPLGFLPRSYGDRLLVVGEAAGHIKATTCGGIYYSMLTAGLAAEVLNRALSENRLDASSLREYEERWRNLLEDEIAIGLRFRRAFYLLSDWQMDRLVAIASRNGILELIHEKADFDWHRELIRAVFRHALVGKLFGSL